MIGYNVTSSYRYIPCQPVTNQSALTKSNGDIGGGHKSVIMLKLH